MPGLHSCNIVSIADRGLFDILKVGFRGSPTLSGCPPPMATTTHCECVEGLAASLCEEICDP